MLYNVINSVKQNIYMYIYTHMWYVWLNKLLYHINTLLCSVLRWFYQTVCHYGCSLNSEDEGFVGKLIWTRLTDTVTCTHWLYWDLVLGSAFLWNQVTLRTSLSARYCTLLKVKGCWMHAQMDSTKDQKQANCEGHYSVHSYVCCCSLEQTVRINSNNLDYKM